MGKRNYPNGGFIACIPQQIEASWDGEWGPHLARFPLNIVYMSVQKSAVDENEILPAITACYEPDLATFRETKKTKEMTHFKREGGTYRVRVSWKASGLLGKPPNMDACFLEHNDAAFPHWLESGEPSCPTEILVALPAAWDPDEKQSTRVFSLSSII